VGGDPWLGQMSDGGKLGNSEFFALEQRQEADAGGIAQQATISVDELEVDDLYPSIAIERYIIRDLGSWCHELHIGATTHFGLSSFAR